MNDLCIFLNCLFVICIRWLKLVLQKTLIGAYFGKEGCRKKYGSYDDIVIPVVEKIVSNHLNPN